MDKKLKNIQNYNSWIKENVNIFDIDNWDYEDMKGSNEPKGSKRYWKFKKGDRVRHPSFGNGTIMNIKYNPNRELMRCTIQFDNYDETKRFMIMFANLEKI